MLSAPEYNFHALIKEIVYYINDSIKKNKKPSSFKNEDSLGIKLDFRIYIEKLIHNWPLKKGSVEKKNIAWNAYASTEDVVKAFVAFIIKYLAVQLQFHNLKFDSTKFSLEEFFKNSFYSAFFWDELKKYYQFYFISPSVNTVSNINNGNRHFAVQNVLPRNSLVILSLDSCFFRLRSGMNQELAGFENFIEDMYNLNNSLIVFSRQKLIQESQVGLRTNNYSISFKLNKDIITTSIYEALEPQTHLVQSNRFIEPNKTGCFDRLLHLLASGQEFIQNLETYCGVGHQVGQ